MKTLEQRFSWYGPHQAWLKGEPGGRQADLSRASLRYADLRHASLNGASLRDADLSGADLRHASLNDADLSRASLNGASLRDADLSRASLNGAVLDPDVPVVPNIDAAILARIEGGGKLEMRTWHTCETTHCRAGWAIVLAGEKGKALEDKIGTNAAAALIYTASRPNHPVPNWYASNEQALADIKKHATQGGA